MKDIEGVYRGILDSLKRTTATALSPELRVSALDRTNREYVAMLEGIRKSLEAKDVMDFSATIVTDKKTGREFSPESLHELLVGAFANTIRMDGSRQRVV